ncbi:hypothetical protein CR513_11628, partial [Mucuna pruriens]
MVNEVSVIDNLRLENQLTELKSLVRQLVVEQHQPSAATRVCGICTFMEHPTNMCPTLQEIESDHPESIGSIGRYQYEKQSMIVNNLEGISTSRIRVKGNIQLKNLDPPRALLRVKIAINRKNLNAMIQDLKMQVGQLANSVSQLQSVGSENLPSQTIPNPKGNASVVSQRSGRELPQQLMPSLSRRPTRECLNKLDLSHSVSNLDSLGKKTRDR